MKLFEIDKSLVMNVIGSYPQSEDMIKGYDYDANNSVYELVYNRNKKIDFSPNLDSFLLTKKAKFTDLLSAIPAGGASGLLISEKFKRLLEVFNIIEHQCFKASVLDNRGNNERYYWMQFISKLCEKIDYGYSKFYRSGGDDYDVLSFEDFLIKKKKLGVDGEIYSKEIALRYNDLKDFDMFYFGYFEFGISENLKDTIEKENITGINITEIKTEIINKNNEKFIVIKGNSFNEKYG